MSETVVHQPPIVAEGGNGFVCPRCGGDVEIREKVTTWGRAVVFGAKVDEDGSAYAMYDRLEEDDQVTESIEMACENNRMYLMGYEMDRYCSWEWSDFNYI